MIELPDTRDDNDLYYLGGASAGVIGYSLGSMLFTVPVWFHGAIFALALTFLIFVCIELKTLRERQNAEGIIR